MTDDMDSLSGNLKIISAVHKSIQKLCIHLLNGNYQLRHSFRVKLLLGILKQFLYKQLKQCPSCIAGASDGGSAVL